MGKRLQLFYQLTNNTIVLDEKIVRIKKLFKASEHNFRAVAFHKKCNNISDTLVLVRTEFGKIIGGFTHYSREPIVV